MKQEIDIKFMTSMLTTLNLVIAAKPMLMQH